MKSKYTRYPYLFHQLSFHSPCSFRTTSTSQTRPTLSLYLLPSAPILSTFYTLLPGIITPPSTPHSSKSAIRHPLASPPPFTPPSHFTPSPTLHSPLPLLYPLPLSLTSSVPLYPFSSFRFPHDHFSPLHIFPNYFSPITISIN